MPFPEWRGRERERKRLIGGLLRIREAFEAADDFWTFLEMTGTEPPPVDPDSPALRFRLPPARNLDDTVLLATWNIRELETRNRGGERLAESYFYIAELISHFDIVSVQEVKDDLTALNRILDLLGDSWRALITDTNKETPGNRERLAVLYDTRKVTHLGISGEFVLPRAARSPQLARTPMVASFEVGWTRFTLAAVHILWGKSTADHAPRVEEIKKIATYLRRRTEQAAKAREKGLIDEWENLILLGDFNIFAPGTKAMDALTKTGRFEIPPELRRLPHTNLAGGRHYDQMAVRSVGENFGLTGRAGAVDWSTLVFRPEDAKAYEKDVKSGMTYNTWRTYQVSDHLMLWVELQIDHATDYLQRRLTDPAR